MTQTGPGSDVCFLCETNPITWPGTGICDDCFQRTAHEAHEAEAEAYERMTPAERAAYDTARGSYSSYDGINPADLEPPSVPPAPGSGSDNGSLGGFLDFEDF